MHTQICCILRVSVCDLHLSACFRFSPGYVIYRCFIGIWSLLYRYFIDTHRYFIGISSVPVIYRSFISISSVFNKFQETDVTRVDVTMVITSQYFYPQYFGVVRQHFPYAPQDDQSDDPLSMSLSLKVPERKGELNPRPVPFWSFCYFCLSRSTTSDSSSSKMSIDTCLQGSVGLDRWGRDTELLDNKVRPRRLECVWNQMQLRPRPRQ